MTKLKPNILLINVHSFNNAGDAALTIVAIDQLRKNFPDSRIEILMNDPKSYPYEEVALLSPLSWVTKSTQGRLMRLSWLIIVSLFLALSQRLTRRSVVLPVSHEINKILNAYLAADIIVSAPGGYLYSYGGGRAYIVICLTILLALLFGKPCYLLPQSFGPLQFAYEIFILRWILNKVRFVMVRESLSYDYIRGIGVTNSNVLLIPDMAFSFKGQSSKQLKSWCAQHNINFEADHPLIGITVLNWGAQYPSFPYQNIYEESIAFAINNFLLKFDGTAYLIPQCWGPTSDEDDRIPANRIAAKISQVSNRVILLNEPLAPEILWGIYGQMDIVVGTRMHSNIFALSQNIPVIALGYLHKTKGLAKDLGIERWVIDLMKIDREELSNKLTELWAEREFVRSIIEAKLKNYRSDISEAGTILWTDYNNYLKQ